MARYDTEPRRQLEPELMQRLGVLVTRWAFVEHSVADIFTTLTEGDTVSMAIVTSNVSQNAISGWIRTLLDIRQVDLGLSNEIQKALNTVDELRPERNALVHGLWSTQGPARSAIVQTMRLERKAIIQEVVVTASDLDDLIDLVNEVSLDLRSILKAIGSEAA